MQATTQDGAYLALGGDTNVMHASMNERYQATKQSHS